MFIKMNADMYSFFVFPCVSIQLDIYVMHHAGNLKTVLHAPRRDKQELASQAGTIWFKKCVGGKTHTISIYIYRHI